MYQKALLTRAAALAAQQGAEIWTDNRKSIENGALSDRRKLELSEMYYYLYDDFNKSYSETIDISSDIFAQPDTGGASPQDLKFGKIRKLIYSDIKKGILRPLATKMSISYTNTLIERRIEVTLSQEIKIPFGALKSFFDGSKTVTLASTGTAVVAEPAEYIRNFDLVLEYAYKTGKALDTGSIAEKVKGILNK